MDLMDSALLADFEFQWHESPFCGFNDGIETLNAQDHCSFMESLLEDMGLPQTTTTIPEPRTSHLSIATSVAKVPPPLQWPVCDSGPLPSVSDILQGSVPRSENIVKFPLVQQKGATVDANSDVGLEKLATDSTSPQSDSAPYTPPAVKQTRRSSKRKANSKAKEPAKSRILEDVAQVNVNRPPTHAEHIIRERLRRDDMAAKYLILESLLPPAPKRERAAVVEDAALLVGDLQQKKAQLLKRRAHLKLVQAPNQHSPSSTLKIVPSSQLYESPGTPCIKQQLGFLTATVGNISCKQDSPLSSSEAAMKHREILNTERATLSTINVHAGNNDIVIEMVWNRPPPHFHSTLLQAVENLGSEVTSCSIVTATTGLVQCFITCSKPQVPSQLKLEIQACETLIVGALRNVLTQSS
ncbi:hypothetical protein KC19_3G134400 [Ceratodon purpureus]|uniref:BHLH domain-containing protein n=1 Tax=Ceratodon purpureus TaxID=3225 RepID=A0A8T0IK71_CERPU|nr:hypothetical protein KC19_3G134400 [Ceratodon purpureus]